MFGLRPDLTRRDLNVDGQDNTPGFRVTDAGFGANDPASSTTYPRFGATYPGLGNPDIGFRVTDPGVRPAEDGPWTYSDGPSGASQSIVPVKWGTESTSDSHSTPSIWDDAQNASARAEVGWQRG